MSDYTGVTLPSSRNGMASMHLHEISQKKPHHAVYEDELAVKTNSTSQVKLSSRPFCPLPTLEEPPPSPAGWKEKQRGELNQK